MKNLLTLITTADNLSLENFLVVIVIVLSIFGTLVYKAKTYKAK